MLLLGVSLACARCSGSTGYAAVPLSGRTECKKMADADDECHKWRSSRWKNYLDFQEFMIVPVGAESFRMHSDGCGNLSFFLKKFCRKKAN